VIPMAVVLLVSRRALAQRYEAGPVTTPRDTVLFWTVGTALVALLPLLVSGLPVWMPATAAAAVIVIVYAVRRRSALRIALVPWPLLLLASGLFLFIAALHAAGLGSVLARVAGLGESPLALLRLSLTATVSGNAINNLPAYLALEPVAGSPIRVAAVLIGVNVGPLIAPWASLATLLWHQRLAALGVEVRWSRYVALGALVAPVTVVAATLALAATS